MTYSIKALHYATQVVRGPQVVFQGAWDERITFYYYVFLVRGEGLIALVDCGMDDVGPLNEVLRPALGSEGVVRLTTREQSVAALLGDEGVRPEDIDVVAFTHFHADHIANARMFPQARYLVSTTGWRQHRSILGSFPQMVAPPVFPSEVIEFLAQVEEERLELAPDGETTILPGVEVRHIGGHTADSAAFVIPTGEGPVIVPGDTIWTYRNLEEDHPVGSAVDILQCYQAMAWARESGHLVLPCHDPGILERHPHGIRQ